ncbi:Translocation protein SEC72 [Nakaseomyces bracarensis]|uniref:Translocation protein SEC72 n=1 Tax=Nakaseomyces bracarensis TaxID=273131 RepID=A0ABR4NPP1_9SACH
MALVYNENSKKISSEIENESIQTNIVQINHLTQSLVGVTKPILTPEPNNESTKMIKNLFENAIQNIQKRKFPEALKSTTLAIEMAQRKRAPWEAFAVQLQELQFMTRQKIDLALSQKKYVEALQDIDFMLNTAFINSDMFIRKCDALINLGQLEEARVTCERGLSMQPNETKLKAMMYDITRRLAEYNGDI